MTTELVIRDQAHLDRSQLEEISRTDFVPKGLRNNVPAIVACVETGRALGIPDMAALRSIHIVDGKATFSAELMVSLVRRAGHSITGEVSADAVRVKGRRGDNGDELAVEWTLEMANRAGLKGKQNWQRYPEAMLWARAVSQLCRMLFPDVFIGATYTPEEIGAADTDAHGVPVDEIVGEVVDDDGLFPPIEAGGAADSGGFVAPPAAPSEAMLKKLNVLVGTLRDRDQVIATGDVYEYVGRPLPDGDVRWSPLRDSLTKAEAKQLIDTLQTLEQSLPRPLTLRQMNAGIRQNGWDPEQLSQVAHRLYPDATSAKELSDRQRGILVAAAEQEL